MLTIIHLLREFVEMLREEIFFRKFIAEIRPNYGEQNSSAIGLLSLFNKEALYHSHRSSKPELC